MPTIGEALCSGGTELNRRTFFIGGIAAVVTATTAEAAMAKRPKLTIALAPDMGIEPDSYQMADSYGLSLQRAIEKLSTELGIDFGIQIGHDDWTDEVTDQPIATGAVAAVQDYPSYSFGYLVDTTHANREGREWWLLRGPRYRRDQHGRLRELTFSQIKRPEHKVELFGRHHEANPSLETVRVEKQYIQHGQHRLCAPHFMLFYGTEQELYY